MFSKNYWKKLIRIGLLIVFLPVSILSVKAVTNLISMAAEGINTLSLLQNVSGEVGKILSLPVILNPSGGNIEGVDVRLTFDPSALMVNQIDPMADPTTGFSTYLPLNSSNVFDKAAVISKANQTGVIEFSLITFDTAKQSVTGSFKSSTPVVLANISFTPLKSGTHMIAFDFDSANPKSTTDSNVVMTGKPPTDGLTSVTNLNLVVRLPAQSQLNILNNADFETGTLSEWTNSSATLLNISSDVHNGAYSARLSGTNSYVSQNIASKLKPDVQYTFSTWVKVNTAGTSWGVPTLRISKFKDLGTGNFGESKAENSTAKGWQQLKITKKFSSSELTGDVNIGVRNFGFTGVDAVDEFTVVETSSAVTPTPSISSTPAPTVIPTPTSTPLPTSTPVPTPTPTLTIAPVEKTVTLTAETANQDGSAVSVPASWIGTGANNGSSYLGLRFAGLNIPQGSKITSAKIEVRAKDQQWIQTSFDIYGENVDNSSAFGSSASLSSRSLTSDKVSYSSNVEWKTDIWYSLQDASGVVASIISRSNWKAGNNLSLILKGTGSAFGRKQITQARITITSIY